MNKTVSIIIINEDKKILSLRRSLEKKFYGGKWDIISGKIENEETADEAFKRELYEEAGIEDFRLIQTAVPFKYKENGKEWFVHSFLCQINHNNIKLNNEHTDFKWMEINDLLSSDCAAPLKEELMVFEKFFCDY